ncbi:hypothetical protein CIPAW_16G050800 [Carya illinoinensis]|uniref:Uncharacterized protein n=1 Tax=Carya illinoinensis TaxID=32201 RepID=A0A8T1N1Z2_CARIL|nr:hypothetical protein CIPAW_16G050800 [Carya illinoinensis]
MEKAAYSNTMVILCDDVKTKPVKKSRPGGRNRVTIFLLRDWRAWRSSPNAVSLVTYFYHYMNFSLTKSATTLKNFTGTAFLLPLVGGFICDTYFSRFKTCVLFASIELLGYALLTVQAHFHQLRPIPCKDGGLYMQNNCEEADTSHVAILFNGLYMIALGIGGVKAAPPALEADQFNDKDPKEAAQLSSFFNWFLFSLTTGAIIGVTFVVWITSNQGWEWGFGICTVAVLFELVFVCMGKSMYRNNVFVAAIRNRKLSIPENAEGLQEPHDKERRTDDEILERTEQFRFLDRAAIIQRNNDAWTTTSWSLCTVTQVEEAKILIRMLPIIFSTVFMNTCLAQLQTFSIQQSTTMNPCILGFKVPAPSIPAIPLLFIFRIGIGLVLSAISMAVAGVIETRRKSVALEHNMLDSVKPLPMSVFWLGFQYAIFGVADMFSLVGLLEFFYAESSAGMNTAISWCSVSFGYFMSTVVVEVVNKVSGGWLASNNLNRDKLNYFYWLLSVMSMVNFVVEDKEDDPEGKLGMAGAREVGV